MALQTIGYQCPHCGKEVAVEALSESQVVSCPHDACGKLFRVEVPTAEPAPSLIVPASPDNGREAVEPEPAIAPLTDAGRTIPLVMFRRYPLRCLGYGLLIGLGLAALVVGRYQGWFLMWSIGLGVAAFALFRLGLWRLRMRNSILRITPTQFIVEQGIFARATTAVALDEVENVQVMQSRWQRLLKVGDIALSCNDSSSPRVIVMGVENPETVAAQLQRKAGRRSEANAPA